MTPRDPDPRFVTVPEAARLFRIGARHLRRVIRQGQLRSYTAGTNRLRVAVAEVEAWLRSTYRPPPPSAVASADARLAEVLEREGRRGCVGVAEAPDALERSEAGE